MHVVRVRLRKPRRVFSFLCDDPTIQRDEACVVQTDRGTEWGTCVLPPEPLPQEMRKRYSMRMLRRVDDEDRSTQSRLEEEERKAQKICLEKIRERRLPMKLVDTEYTFDKQKVIFYFTAEDRVDFRELVRDLAHDLRTRIEMRHIQVRDEAKMVGGIGSCGRELCCSTWLNEFKPISMRMAKRQNLSLNPSKISGQCGRLLCCLSYENDQYETAKRRAKQDQEGAKQDQGTQQERGAQPEQATRQERGARADVRAKADLTNRPDRTSKADPVPRPGEPDAEPAPQSAPPAATQDAPPAETPHAAPKAEREGERPEQEAAPETAADRAAQQTEGTTPEQGGAEGEGKRRGRRRRGGKRGRRGKGES